ncbi:UbiA family prenyltransferase [Streptomyces sp. NPDC059443]|uniref:UbiA family prenyltransferase n=1 Tax=unclassified Streptomyces TaxID=2593676 RepID=UPI0036CF684E
MRNSATPLDSSPATRNPLRILLLCWQESRIAVQLIFLMRFLLAGTAGTVSYVSLPPLLFAGAAVWSLAVTSAYLYNGVTDVNEDRANGSTRPIGRGALTLVHARRTARILAALALAGGAWIGPAMLTVTALMILLGYVYSAPGIALKSSTPGTMVTVIASGALTYAAGALCAGTPVGPSLIVFCTAMCLWMGLVGSVAKDFSDTTGDAKHGRRNWTLVRGRAYTAAFVSVSAMCVGTGLLASAFVLAAPQLLAPAVVMLGGALAVTAAAFTGHRDDSRSRRRLPYRIFMVTQYAAHLVAFAQPVG